MISLLLLPLLQGAVAVPKPVVLVPGALASQIEARLNKKTSPHFYCAKKSDWFTLWLSIEYILGPALSCWADNFKLEFEDGTFRNTAGVETRVPGFGGSRTLNYADSHSLLSYYRDLVEALLTLDGAVEGVTVKSAPFDYRYSAPSLLHNTFHDKLQRMIEETYTETGGRKIVLISHSLGGPTTSTFLHGMTDQWKDTYIDSWVSISGVFGGALKVVKAMVSHGVMDQLPSIISDRFIHRRVARTIMGNYFMLPKRPVYGPEDILLRTPNRNYTVDNLDQLFLDLGVPLGPEMLETVANSSYVGDPSVPVHCFNGKDIQTTSSYFYTKQKDFPDEIPTDVWGDGDGTVPARALKVCHGWESTRSVTEYSGKKLGEHGKILDNKDFIKRVIDIVTDNQSCTEKCAFQNRT